MAPPRRIVRSAPRVRFRDRFFTRKTAEAIMAPLSIVGAGVGVAAAVLAGLPEVAAGAAGLAVYAGAVVAQMPRARVDSQQIDPRLLREPWRRHVAEALDAEQRFADAVAATPPGPLHDRLGDMRLRVSDAVSEAWRIANRGQQLELALGRLDSSADLRQRLGASGVGDDVAAALRSQLATYERIEATARDTRDRLRVHEARLDETVARAIEVGLRAGDPIEIGVLDDDVESLVDEMEALRRGLDETQAAAVPTRGMRGA